MEVKQIREILEAPYNRKVWKSFIQTQFTNNNLLANDSPLNLGKSDLYTECYSLGNYAVDDYTKIGIFEIQLADKVNLTRNRVALRNLIKDITKQVAGAMVVFVQGDKWRFSYVSKRKVRNKENNTIEDKETAPKRYTYLFGNGEKALTAAIRFDRLIQKQQGNLYQFLTLNDFEEAFSVEKLSKEFFGQYKNIYDDFVEFVTGKRYVKKGSKFIETQTHEAHFQLRNYFNNDEKQARDFFKRMMGRIVFLYFIQKKGWLAVPKAKQWGEGNPDYLFELYKNAKYKDSFYSEYLVPLFFDTLCNEEVQKEHNEFRFPYLNGGLFDKAQDFKYNKLALPAQIFEKLFKTFSEYNFTIYEDAPDEHTVAVDPEMLGHIFENLLEDNKDKGAFYTPKDIVHYMCRESLHNYIYTYTGNADNEDFKTKLKLYNNNYDIAVFEKEEIKQIDRALEDVKICDPAIGSGAFPMGLLHEIYHLKIPIEDAKGFKAKTPADLKKHIIEESIYGVDIDSGAVDIARLRFWLSLVVDEVAPQPLPNLAFKIVCANTLIPLGKPKSDLSGSLDIAKAIEKLRHNYFDASKEDKKDLEREFKNLQNKLWATAKDWVSKEDGDIYLKISEFNPFEDKSCTWFDAWWMFGVKDGFDIVIGNPPYVQMQKDSGKLSELLKSAGYKTFERTGDLYAIFYELGFKILKKNGIHTFITSSQWMKANYGKSLRKLFLTKNPLKLIALGPGAFENAVVDTNILIAQNSDNRNELLGTMVLNKEETENLNTLVFMPMCYINEDAWTILDVAAQEIKQTIKEKGKPLSEWNVEIYRGVLTGFNEAFIIDEEKKRELIKQDAKNAEWIKPILKGRKIQKYLSVWENDYIVFVPWHFPLQDNPKITGASDDAEREFSIKFGSLYEYLNSHKKGLSERNKEETGIRYEWYALQRSAATYREEFSKEKVIWKRIGSKLRFSYSDKEMYCLDSTCIATGEKIKYLTALLNSKLCQYQLFESAPKTGMGDLIISVQALEPLLVYYPLPEEQKPFDILVDYLLHLHNNQSEQIFTHTTNERLAAHIEDVLNMMVYELYFEKHMKEVGIDVLAMVNCQLLIINEDKTPINNLPLTIKHFYEWYQKPDNAVRQRIEIANEKSPNILAVINKATH
jgi:adenine-specific DNA-methyltransferase